MSTDTFTPDQLAQLNALADQFKQQNAPAVPATPADRAEAALAALEAAVDGSGVLALVRDALRAVYDHLNGQSQSQSSASGKSSKSSASQSSASAGDGGE